MLFLSMRIRLERPPDVSNELQARGGIGASSCDVEASLQGRELRKNTVNVCFSSVVVFFLPHATQPVRTAWARGTQLGRAEVTPRIRIWDTLDYRARSNVRQRLQELGAQRAVGQDAAESSLPQLLTHADVAELTRPPAVVEA